MSVWKFVALLLAILVSSPESETANITAFITNSSSPSYAVEGQSFTLEWTYTLDGTVGFVQFSIVASSGSELIIGRKLGAGVITVEPEYQARFSAQATNTRAELNILTVQKSDAATYRVNIVPSGSGSLLQLVIVIVYFPPTITDISENQTVSEGGNVTLECQADSKPKSNTTWTRLSDNRIINMPLTDIRRKDAGTYRCTADNGVGSPSIGDVLVIVEYPVEAIGFGENATVPEGGNKTFICLVDGIPKPNISWYRGSDVIGTPIFRGEKFEASESGCYTCVASNSLGKPAIITHCLKNEEDVSTVSASTTSAPKGPSRTVIGVVTGVAVFMVIVIGLVTWWVCKKKKHAKRTKNAELQYEEVDQANKGTIIA